MEEPRRRTAVLRTFFLQSGLCRMGSELGSCCGGCTDHTPQDDIITDSCHDDICKRDTEPFNDATKLKKAREQFYKGFRINLILQNQTKLECVIQLDQSHAFLLLTNNKKARIIHMRDIKDILHTSDDLSRIEKDAGIRQDNLCAAIQLETTGTCIPLFFKNVEEKSIFLALVMEAKKSLTETRTTPMPVHSNI